MSEPEDILKQEDMETSRSPRDLCAWVDAKASELAQSEEGKAYARSGARLPKKLMEEVRPFGLFAYLRFGSDDVTCVPNLGNENFDGQIQFADPAKESIYVELTYAKDGYDENLRLGVLTQRGDVNPLGSLTVTGTKASGNQRVEVGNEAVDRNSIVKSGLSLVSERLTGKSGKKYGPRHVLVIVVDDYITFRWGDDKAALIQCAVTTASNLSMDFGEIYLLGSSGTYLERVHGELSSGQAEYLATSSPNT